VNPGDSVLIAYQLTSAQTAQFKPTDTTVSAFWNLIDSSHDYWNLLPSTSTYSNGGSGFAGDSDAQMNMKAAYDSNGVYFYFRIIDNSWDADTGWQPDKIDLYVDNQSSTAIDTADQTTEYVQGTLTYTCQQYWIPMGGDSTPTIIGLNNYDSNQIAWVNNTLDLTTASQKIKIVKLDSMTRVLEMFIPWANFGIGGVSGMGPVGTQYAISGGYNDADSGNFKGCLRILHMGDPYESDQNYWATLELGPQIAGEVTGIKSAQSRRGLSFASLKIVKSDYYTLTGRKISNPAIVNKPSIGKVNSFVRVDRMSDGTIQHSIVRN
jgi:hypothetical protein